MHCKSPRAVITIGMSERLGKRSTANITLVNQIKEAHAMSDETYGMPRIRAELADLGVVASRKRIAALMRANAIAGVTRRRGYCVTTVRNPKRAPGT
jgi:putative transposase